MNRMASILGYSNNRKDNIMLFSMQLVVATLAFVEYVNSWAIIFMTLVWLFTSNFSKVNFKSLFKTRKLGIFFILYFVWLVIGLLYTEDIDSGLQNIVLKLSFIIFPFVLLYNERINQRFLRGVVRVFYYTMFLVSMYMLIAAWIKLLNSGTTDFAESLGYFTYENLASNIHIQPIYISMYMVFSFFAVLWDFYLDPRIGFTKSGKTVAGIWMFHFYMMVILLSSRMELLVLLFVSFIAIGYYDGVLAKKWPLAIFKMLAFASLTVVLLGLFPVNKARYQEMVDTEKDYTETQYGGRSIRIHKWLNTLELISMQPFLGTGAGDMQTELQKVYKKNNFDLAYNFRFNPHNQYLQTWASNGMIGLFLLLGIFLISFLYALDSKNALYVALVLILSLSMLTESMLQRQKGLVFFSFFLLFFASYYFNNKERNSNLPPN